MFPIAAEPADDEASPKKRKKVNQVRTRLSYLLILNSRLVHLVIRKSQEVILGRKD
jgi:hypothetical protein